MTLSIRQMPNHVCSCAAMRTALVSRRGTCVGLAAGNSNFNPRNPGDCEYRRQDWLRRSPVGNDPLVTRQLLCAYSSYCVGPSRRPPSYKLRREKPTSFNNVMRSRCVRGNHVPKSRRQGQVHILTTGNTSPTRQLLCRQHRRKLYELDEGPSTSTFRKVTRNRYENLDINFATG